MSGRKTSRDERTRARRRRRLHTKGVLAFLGDPVTAHVWHRDITAVSGRELVQATGDDPRGAPLYIIASGLACAAMGGLGLMAAWWWLRRTDDRLAGHPRELRVSGWIAMGLVADAFAALWVLLWLDGPYWLHPIVRSAVAFPVLAALPVQHRKRSGGEW
ncbi:hypothetical protein AB0D94_36965 [Streptomyces sp. NPDC048255]|uniref:hypothetical protein n=1 Tax=Streptomyces sp. NPDC048255 TaxID=3154713 RepID=UPI003403B2C1